MSFIIMVSYKRGIAWGKVEGDIALSSVLRTIGIILHTKEIPLYISQFKSYLSFSNSVYIGLSGQCRAPLASLSFRKSMAPLWRPKPKAQRNGSGVTLEIVNRLFCYHMTADCVLHKPRGAMHVKIHGNATPSPTPA